MYLVYYDDKMRPVRIDTRRVVVHGEHGQPLSVAVELLDSSVIVSHFEDPTFNKILKNLGIQPAAVVPLSPA